MEVPVRCERVVVDYGYAEEIVQLVQYEDTPDEQQTRAKVIERMEAQGHSVDCEAHEVVGPGDDPAVSWEDLSDIVGCSG